MYRLSLHIHTSVPGGTVKRQLEVGGHALVSECQCLEHCTIRPGSKIRTNMHHTIIMQARPRQTDGQTDRWTDGRTSWQ